MDNAEIARLRAALRTIRDQYGHVCEEFDTCDHPACRDSYSAWHVADAALRESGEVERLRAENAALRGWLRLVVQAWRGERARRDRLYHWHVKAVVELAHESSQGNIRAKALTSALRDLLNDPHGCPMCDSGQLRNPEKAHWPECPYPVARAVLGE